MEEASILFRCGKRRKMTSYPIMSAPARAMVRVDVWESHNEASDEEMDGVARYRDWMFSAMLSASEDEPADLNPGLWSNRSNDLGRAFRSRLRHFDRITRLSDKLAAERFAVLFRARRRSGWVEECRMGGRGFKCWTGSRTGCWARSLLRSLHPVCYPSPCRDVVRGY